MTHITPPDANGGRQILAGLAGLLGIVLTIVAIYGGLALIVVATVKALR